MNTSALMRLEENSRVMPVSPHVIAIPIAKDETLANYRKHMLFRQGDLAVIPSQTNGGVIEDDLLKRAERTYARSLPICR